MQKILPIKLITCVGASSCDQLVVALAGRAVEARGILKAAFKIVDAVGSIEMHSCRTANAAVFSEFQAALSVCLKKQP